MKIEWIDRNENILQKKRKKTVEEKIILTINYSSNFLLQIFLPTFVSYLLLFYLVIYKNSSVRPLFNNINYFFLGAIFLIF